MSAPKTGQARSATLHLFVLVFAVYLLTYKGICVADAMFHADATRHLLRYGVLALPAEIHTGESNTAFKRRGRDGQIYLTLAPGLAVAAAPFCAVGTIVEEHLDGGMASQWVYPDPETEEELLRSGLDAYEQYLLGVRRRPSNFFAFLVNPLAVALLVVLVFRFCTRLGESPARAVLIALVGGFSTILWFYSSTAWTQPLAALLLFAGFMTAFSFVGSNRNLLGFLAGLFCGLAFLCRYDMAIAVPWIFVFVLLSRRKVGKGAASMALLSSGVALPVALGLLWNAYRFGSPFDTGSVHQAFQGLFMDGWFKRLLFTAAANLFGLGQGLFVFCPPLILGCLGLPRLIRREPELGWSIVGMSMTLLCFYSSFVLWQTTGGWGPRFLVVLIPFLLLPISRFGERSTSFRILGIGFVIVGFALQLPVIVSPLRATVAMGMPFFNPGAPNYIEVLLASPIPAQLEFVLRGEVEFWWLGRPFLSVVALALTLVAAIATRGLARALAVRPSEGQIA